MSLLERFCAVGFRNICNTSLMRLFVLIDQQCGKWTVGADGCWIEKKNVRVWAGRTLRTSGNRRASAGTPIGLEPFALSQ